MTAAAKRGVSWHNGSVACSRTRCCDRRSFRDNRSPLITRRAALSLLAGAAHSKRAIMALALSALRHRRFIKITIAQNNRCASSRQRSACARSFFIGAARCWQTAPCNSRSRLLLRRVRKHSCAARLVFVFSLSHIALSHKRDGYARQQ